MVPHKSFHHHQDDNIRKNLLQFLQHPFGHSFHLVDRQHPWFGRWPNNIQQSSTGRAQLRGKVLPFFRSCENTFVLREKSRFWEFKFISSMCIRQLIQPPSASLHCINMSLLVTESLLLLVVQLVHSLLHPTGWFVKRFWSQRHP